MRPIDSSYDRDVAQADAAMRALVDVDALRAGDVIGYETAEQIADPAWHELVCELVTRGLYPVDDGEGWRIGCIEGPTLSVEEALQHVERAQVMAALDGNAADTPEARLAGDILAELRRARAKFPGDNVTTLALMEEVGELARATFDEPRERVRAEAVQVAAMAMRVVLDGDATLNAWRAQRGLDPLVARDGGEGEESVSAAYNVRSMEHGERDA